jgi:cytosine/adenosine deaminase-related metal-dependent hydrolase
MPHSLLIRNVRPLGGPAADVLIRNGRIDRIAPGLAVPSPAVEILDGEGCLLMPGLVDGHMHLDKTFVGLPWVPHQGGPTIADKIEADQRVHRSLELSVAEQAGRLIRLALGKGTTHIRSHVDIDPELGLSRLEAMVEAREAFSHAISIQLVAFPQSGVMRRPGTAELLEEAVQRGADLIGGVDPAGIDQDSRGQLDAIFAIAERRGVEIDIHLHDPGELGVHQIGMIAERTRSHGMAGRVAVSHAYCLGTLDDRRVGEAAELLAENGIAIMTTGAAHCPVPPIQRLHEAGVTVFAGSDGVRDAWTPFGDADQLERAMLVALRFNFRADPGLRLAFHAVTQGGAEALHLADYGLEAGCLGDLVLVEGGNIPDIVVTRPTRKVVVKAGRVVARDGVALV